MNDNKNEKTIEQSKQKEKAVGILKKLSKMDEKTKKIISRASMAAVTLALTASHQ